MLWATATVKTLRDDRAMFSFLPVRRSAVAQQPYFRRGQEFTHTNDTQDSPLRQQDWHLQGR